MPDKTPILALPVLVPNQAQPYVTHNDALRRLDILVQLSVIAFGAETPPALPGEGDLYALGAAPVAEWAGQADALAAWIDGSWLFLAPQPGWRAWDRDAGLLRVWDGTAWARPPAELDNVTGVGIGTASDAVNRLAVVSEATLFSHDGAGHQLKINKAGAAETASLLFQSNWTGHAEMGLAGGTDFAIKVSGDGSTWTEALRFDAATGEATGAAVQSGAADTTPGRVMLNGAGGWHGNVATTADDANTAAYGGMFMTSDLSTATNWPSWFGSGPGSLLVVAGVNANNFVQFAFAQNAGIDPAYRNYRAGAFGSWERLPVQGYDADFANLSLSSDMTMTRAANSIIKRNDTAGVQYLFGGTGATDGAGVSLFGSTQATNPNLMVLEGDSIIFRKVDNTEHARIDSSGNVGIGTSSPVAKTMIEQGTAGTDVLIARATSATFARHLLYAKASRAATIDYNFFLAMSDDGVSQDIEFKLKGDGNGTCDGSWTGGGADYAEYFEWLDGNPTREDRRGLSVVLDGAKIRPAVTGEVPFGVISGNPSVIGDGDIDRWKEKYLRDDFGSYLWEAYEITDEDGGAVIQQRRRLNPAYDPTLDYTPRSERPEWDVVGLMGKLRIRKGQPVAPSWIRMRDVSVEVEEWLVR